MRKIMFLLAVLLGGAGQAEAGVITFGLSTPDPNATAVANTGAYGSTAHVSVGYSAYTYNWGGSGYGGLDGGSGNAVYSGSRPYTITMTFTASLGYTVTLDGFDLAQYSRKTDTVTISVAGGTSPYGLTDTPLGGTVAPNFSTYAPSVTGSSLTLTITNLYNVGLNAIRFSEAPVAPVPEPATLAVFGAVALAGALGYRRRKA